MLRSRVDLGSCPGEIPALVWAGASKSALLTTPAWNGNERQRGLTDPSAYQLAVLDQHLVEESLKGDVGGYERLSSRAMVAERNSGPHLA
jgi:hypothetical protein